MKNLPTCSQGRAREGSETQKAPPNPSVTKPDAKSSCGSLASPLEPHPTALKKGTRAPMVRASGLSGTLIGVALVRDLGYLKSSLFIRNNTKLIKNY